MDIKKFGPDDIVIKEGDDGEELFIVQEGQLKCYKATVDEKNEKNLKGKEIF